MARTWFARLEDGAIIFTIDLHAHWIELPAHNPLFVVVGATKQLSSRSTRLSQRVSFSRLHASKLEAPSLKIARLANDTRRLLGLHICLELLENPFGYTRKVTRIFLPYSEAVTLDCTLSPAQLSHPVEKRRRSLGDEARALPHATTLYIPAIQKQDLLLLSNEV
jgi:hypothetical protein